MPGRGTWILRRDTKSVCVVELNVLVPQGHAPAPPDVTREPRDAAEGPDEPALATFPDVTTHGQVPDPTRPDPTLRANGVPGRTHLELDPGKTWQRVRFLFCLNTDQNLGVHSTRNRSETMLYVDRGGTITLRSEPKKKKIPEGWSTGMWYRECQS